MSTADETRQEARCAGERGQMGGAEVLPFVFLIFVVGLLVIFNAWLVIDARMATASAAREGARVLVEGDLSGAEAKAAARIEEAVAAYGRLDASAVSIAAIDYETGTFGRCARVTVTVNYETPFIAIPFIGGAGSRTVSMSHSELIDPYRDGEQEGTCL